MTRFVSVGNLESAVSLLLSTSPDSSYFYPNALRAVALSSTISKSLVELAVKVKRGHISSISSKSQNLSFYLTLFPYEGSCCQYGKVRQVTFWNSSSMFGRKIPRSMLAG